MFIIIIKKAFYFILLCGWELFFSLLTEQIKSGELSTATKLYRCIIEINKIKAEFEDRSGLSKGAFSRGVGSGWGPLATPFYAPSLIWFCSWCDSIAISSLVFSVSHTQPVVTSGLGRNHSVDAVEIRPSSSRIKQLLKGTICNFQKCLLTATLVAVKSTKISVGLTLARSKYT